MGDSSPRQRSARRAVGVISTLGFACVAAGFTAGLGARPITPSLARPTMTAPAPVGVRAGLWFLDSLVGRSRKLRALFVTPSKPSFGIQALERLFGDSAVTTPGVYTVRDSDVAQPISLISLVPFSAKERGRIGTYRLGFWPFERRTARNPAYANPDGFVQVTPANEDTYVSEHFRLRDFLTHDQVDVWPKYLVLNEKLIDKLELVIEDLDAHGVPVEHLAIMSGFRTPEYNVLGVGRRGGRARDSRHQYGDAADVFVDNGESGTMDDLNHDGRVNVRDARLIMEAVDRVEEEHPDLVGGMGLYRATRAHPPFVHIDTRGDRARWGGAR